MHQFTNEEIYQPILTNFNKIEVPAVGQDLDEQISQLSPHAKALLHELNEQAPNLAADLRYSSFCKIVHFAQEALSFIRVSLSITMNVHVCYRFKFVIWYCIIWRLINL